MIGDGRLTSMVYWYAQSMVIDMMLQYLLDVEYVAIQSEKVDYECFFRLT